VPATATALVGAGLVSVIAFPALAFSLLGEASRVERAELARAGASR
jgi:hypothetical protein